jgi:hypothetical protein
LPSNYQLVEASETLRDANFCIKQLQRADDFYADSDDQWQQTYGANGCLCVTTEDGEGGTVELRVSRVPMKRAGRWKIRMALGGGQEDDGLVDDRERLRRKKMRLRLRRKPRTKTRLRSNSRKPERRAKSGLWGVWLRCASL